MINFYNAIGQLYRDMLCCNDKMNLNSNTEKHIQNIIVCNFLKHLPNILG